MDLTQVVNQMQMNDWVAFISVFILFMVLLSEHVGPVDDHEQPRKKR